MQNAKPEKRVSPMTEQNNKNAECGSEGVQPLLCETMMMIGLNPGPRARTVKPGPRHQRTRPDPGQNRLGPHKGIPA